MTALVVIPNGIDENIEVYTFKKWEQALDYMKNLFYEDLNNESEFNLNKNDTWLYPASGEAKLSYNDGSYYNYIVTYVTEVIRK